MWTAWLTAAGGTDAASSQAAAPERARRSGPRAALGLTALMLAHHLGLWVSTSFSRGLPLLGILNRWDSDHYSRIVLEGYVWPLWAFLPLYPGAVWLVRTVLGGGLPPQGVGSVLSTLCLLAFVAWNARWSRQGTLAPPLTPSTLWGWFFFLYGPASFALHSHHTEGLFLLLSFGALAFAARGRMVPAALCAALCVWTRNQGVFVALATALLVAGPGRTGRERLLRFAGVGAVALAAFAGMLAFEWKLSGHPLTHMLAQREWRQVDSLGVALRGLWLGNPWHDKAGWWLGLRHAFGAVWLVASVALLRRGLPVGLYALLSLLVMVPQGDLGNAFRFGAVLFPVLFWVGDWVAARPVWFRCSSALLMVWLNHKVTHAYAIGSWAY